MSGKDATASASERSSAPTRTPSASSSPLDCRADIYALGITLYELCCGRRPFDEAGKGEPAQVIIARHLSVKPPDPRNYNNRGVALAGLGQTEAARADFQRALKMDPSFSEARQNLEKLGR